MTERSGRRTVPQVFIDDMPIGGFDELSMIDLPDKQDEDHTSLIKGGIYP
jgi:glutaredoxin 3